VKVPYEAAMQTVELELDKSWRWRLGCLGLLLFPLALLFGAGAVNTFLKGQGPGLVLLFLFFSTVGAFAYFPLHARRWARRIDERGVTLRNGQFLPWSEYQGLTRTLRGGSVTRYMLRFSSGNAFVIPLLTGNYGDVRPVMDELSQPK
jgi:hypothetical protein